MDSTFLKSDFEGQLITLCIQDDNKMILLIAAASVDKEDESNSSQGAARRPRRGRVCSITSGTRPPHRLGERGV